MIPFATRPLDASAGVTTRQSGDPAPWVDGVSPRAAREPGASAHAPATGLDFAATLLAALGLSAPALPAAGPAERSGAPGAPGPQGEATAGADGDGLAAPESLAAADALPAPPVSPGGPAAARADGPSVPDMAGSERRPEDARAAARGLTGDAVPLRHGATPALSPDPGAAGEAAGRRKDGPDPARGGGPERPAAGPDTRVAAVDPNEIRSASEVRGASEMRGAGEARFASELPSPSEERDTSEVRLAEAGRSPGEVAATGSSTAPDVSAPLPVSQADRSWAHLDPRLRERLERVVERMRTEHGHRVELVEGYRSPERQAHLFEQGRSRPGPVVTWTRVSGHSAGRAADLMVDGSFEGREGYARLQEIARQEGLATLGMRDAGHVELPEREPPVRFGPARTGSAMGERTEALGAAPLRAAAPPPSTGATVQAASTVPGDELARVAFEPVPVGSSGMARLADFVGMAPMAGMAPVAGVASVAGVAAPARVARPARPGEAAPARAPEPVAAASPMPDELQGLTAYGPAAHGSAERRGRRVATETIATGTPATSRDPEGGAGDPALSHGAGPVAPGRQSPTGPMALAGPQASGPDVLARVEQVLEARELARGLRPGSVSIHLDGTAGAVERVRVGLAGLRVDADLDIADSGTAALLRSRVAELHGALEARGLDLATFRTHQTGRPGSFEAGAGFVADTPPDLLRALVSQGAAEDRRDSTSGHRWAQHESHEGRDGRGSDRSAKHDGQERRHADHR